MRIPVEGFFDGVDIMAKAMESTSAIAQGAPTKVPIPSPKPSPIKESARTERVCESVPTLAEIPTPQKEVTPAGA